MLFVVEEPVAPVGSCHTYDVAPATGATEKTTPEEFRQAPVGPLIAPGAERNRI